MKSPRRSTMLSCHSSTSCFLGSASLGESPDSPRRAPSPWRPRRRARRRRRPGDERARGFLRGRHALQALHGPPPSTTSVVFRPVRVCPRFSWPVSSAPLRRSHAALVREEPLEASPTFALALGAARHRRPAPRLGVLRHLAEHLGGCGGIGGFALVVLQRRRQRRRQARRSARQLLRDARLRRTHAAVESARRVPRAARRSRSPAGGQAQTAEHLESLLARALRREKLLSSARLAHLEHLVAPRRRAPRRAQATRRAHARAVLRCMGQFVGGRLPTASRRWQKRSASTCGRRPPDAPRAAAAPCPTRRRPSRAGCSSAALRRAARPDAPRRVEASAMTSRRDPARLPRPPLPLPRAPGSRCAPSGARARGTPPRRPRRARGGVRGRPDHARSSRGVTMPTSGAVAGSTAPGWGQPSQTQVVPQAGLGLGEEPLRAWRRLPGRGSLLGPCALELRVQRADGRVRHGGDGDVRGTRPPRSARPP